MLSLDLANEIIEELANPDYLGRTHGRHSAYSKGCNGPLCNKYNRDKVRETYRRRNPLARRARGSRNPELDDLLTKVIAEHAKQMQQRTRNTEREILKSAS